MNYTENIIPAMTSNSMAGHTITSSSYYNDQYLPWKAFDRIIDSYWATSSSFATGWIACEFPIPKKVVKFTILNRLDATSPKAFTFDGFDGTNWITLLARTSAETPNWKDGEKREYVVTNNKSYLKYRLNITEVQTAGRTPEIRELEMMEELILEKMLLQSDDKVRSLESINTWRETKMTSDTTPFPLVASASTVWGANFPAWKAFNGTNTATSDCWVTAGGTITGWIQLNFGAEVVFNQIILTSRYDAAANAAPRDFTISGSNDGTNFTELKTFRNATNWTLNESRTFRFNNFKPYKIYRLTILTNDGFTSYSAIGELKFGFYKENIVSLPKISKENFLKYGFNDTDFNKMFTDKIYVMQDAISESEQRLLTSKLDRKPLSIILN